MTGHTLRDVTNVTSNGEEADSIVLIPAHEPIFGEGVENGTVLLKEGVATPIN